MNDLRNCFTVDGDFALDANNAREIDRLAIQEYGIDGYQLMQNAAYAVYREVKQRWPSVNNPVIICGFGNNGGDGFVIGKYFIEDGITPILMLLGEEKNIKGDAKKALDDFLEVGGEIGKFEKSLIDSSDLVVDAIFGTGLCREVSGVYFDVIEAINKCDANVISVDIPSGISADSGAVLGIAIEADVTVTFMGKKIGHVTSKGKGSTGSLVVDYLGVPKHLFSKVEKTTLFSKSFLEGKIKPRSQDVHKGDFGRVLIVGGNYNMVGAALLAGETALRVGAGLVTVATRPEHALNIALARPELMSIAFDSQETLIEAMNVSDVVIIGPGLGQDDWAEMAVKSVLECGSNNFARQQKLLIDADALNIISKNDTFKEQFSKEQLSKNVVITPHPGEAGRLLSVTTQEIQQNRIESAKQLYKNYKCSAVIKGAGSVIVDAEGDLGISVVGNPGMATAGMGDVLSGVIGGLLAQGYNSSTATKIGVVMHGLAGDLASNDGGERGMIASDLFPYLREISNSK